MALFFRILVWSLRTLHFLAYRQCQRQARQARLKTTGSHPLNALFGNPMEPVVFIRRDLTSLPQCHYPDSGAIPNYRYRQLSLGKNCSSSSSSSSSCSSCSSSSSSFCLFSSFPLKAKNLGWRVNLNRRQIGFVSPQVVSPETDFGKTVSPKTDFGKTVPPETDFGKTVSPETDFGKAVSGKTKNRQIPAP